MHRSIHSLTSSIVISLTLFTQAATTLSAQKPAEKFAGFTGDGGWCWFSNPRAVSRDGKTYTGWVTQDGSVQAAELNHASGRVTTVDLHKQYQRDDHDNPSFVFLPDGRLMAFYSQHNFGKLPPAIHSRTTVRPGDFTEWTPEVALPISEKLTGTGISYCNPHLLSDENNALYLFWRGKTFKPTMSKSTDGGKTWTPAQVVFSRAGLPSGNRPYGQYASNGKDRIHLLFTDGHPSNEAHNSVYYACYRAGAFYKADGTRICGMNELPFRPEQADCVYDATRTGVRAWVWDLAFDKNDNPVVAYTRLPEETDHRYHYARWDGKQWQVTELCAGGKWFPQTLPGKKEGEPYYSSGLSLDHSAPSIVYLSRPVNGVREIERWNTANGGKSWTSEAVTANSKFDNVRPIVVRNHAQDGPTVLWMNIDGGYVHFSNYRTSIKMDRPAKTIVSAPTPSPVSVAAPSSSLTQPPVAVGAPLSAAIAPAAVLTAMERVADWQLANPSKHKATDWTQGAGYAGMMALADISKDVKYRDAMLAMGRGNGWKPGPLPYHADDHCVGQTYVELYLLQREPGMIAPLRERFDFILANQPADTNLEFHQKGSQERWSWCDALFMAPPAWVQLSAATGEAKYLDYAVQEWWRTTDYLYDKDEHLFFRDSTYFNKREVNGKKVFWARGNGWVMGGLVRVLQYLPKNHPDRPRFEQLFKDMAAKILTCQQPDGLWRASLLDPDRFPLKETSGSGFYTYALTWGVNQGLLERAQFEPAVHKAWATLIGCVAADGKLMHVQPIGESPDKFKDDSTEVYGVGAFLLAGSEIYRMAPSGNK